MNNANLNCLFCCEKYLNIKHKLTILDITYGICNFCILKETLLDNMLEKDFYSTVKLAKINKKEIIYRIFRTKYNSQISYDIIKYL